MACFPRTQLKFMVEHTSRKLVKAGKAPVTIGELLKWFGVTILITRCEFSSRDSLWSKHPPSNCRYLPAYELGSKTGMTRDRFNDLMMHMVWSEQPAERPAEMSSERYRWMLVDGYMGKGRTSIELSTTAFPTGSVWMNPCLGGMAWVVIGSTKAFRTIFLLTESPRMVVRFKTAVTDTVALCSG